MRDERAIMVYRWFPAPSHTFPMIFTSFFILGSACLLLAWIDFRHGIIPDWLNLGIAILGSLRAAGRAGPAAEQLEQLTHPGTGADPAQRRRPCWTGSALSSSVVFSASTRTGFTAPSVPGAGRLRILFCWSRSSDTSRSWTDCR